MKSIIVEAIVKININQIRIKDVFLMFKLHVNSLLVSKLVLNDLKVQFKLNGYIVKYCDNEAKLKQSPRA